MITVTAPNGEKVHISPSSITKVYANTGHTYHPKAKSVLVYGNDTQGIEHQAVIETVDEVEALIRG